MKLIKFLTVLMQFTANRLTVDDLLYRNILTHAIQIIYTPSVGYVEINVLGVGYCKILPDVFLEIELVIPECNYYRNELRVKDNRNLFKGLRRVLHKSVLRCAMECADEWVAQFDDGEAHCVYVDPTTGKIAYRWY